MEIYQLRTFVTVARERSITRASELLFLSQPAVSAHIKAMEDELGLALFERTSRGMSPTDHGTKLLPKAEQILALHQELVDEARRIKGGVSGKIRVGSNRTTSALVMGKLLTRLAETAPDLEVALKYGNSAEILRSLRNSALDAGFYTDDGNQNQELETSKWIGSTSSWPPLEAGAPIRHAPTGGDSHARRGSAPPRTLVVDARPKPCLTGTASVRRSSSAWTRKT